MRLAIKLTALAAVAAGAIALVSMGPGSPGVLAEPPLHAAGAGGREEVRFGRDIRPILSDRCFTCHGPDAPVRQANMRLDEREGALALRDGVAAIVPGSLEKSALWARINATDPDVVMPPPDSEKHALSPGEKALIRRWIESGAEYEPHWAFVPPERPPLPATSGWARNAVDHFILERLQAAGLEPSGEADRATLLRRVFLDLTGLPPTLEELDAFLSDTRPDAYERWVDLLLTEEPYRTRYAERMATPWLDQARYADTIGIHTDAGRSIWPWRDWVLEAYRRNMPFDEFVTQQLAGDLLPDATMAQKIATGFHRAHVISDEGGAIDEEYLVEYAVDRVATTGSVFLGLTLGCARCHDHKFDPVTQEDFYGLMAFFNNIREQGVYIQQPDPKRAFEPFLSIPSPEQVELRTKLEADTASAIAARDNVPPEEVQQRQAFLAEVLARAGVQWPAASVFSAESTGGATLQVQEDGSVLASGANPDSDEHRLVLRTDARNLRLLMLEALGDPTFFGGRVGRAPNGNAVLNGIAAEAVSIADPSQRQPVAFEWAWADVEQTNGDFKVVNVFQDGDTDGWAVDAHNQPGTRMAVLLADAPFGFEGGTELHVTLKYDSRYAQHAFGRVRLRVGQIGDAGIAMLPEAPGTWHIAGPFPKLAEGAYEQQQEIEKAGDIDLTRTFAEGAGKWLPDPSIFDGRIKVLPQTLGPVYIGRRVYSPTQRQVDIYLGSDDGIRVFANGEELVAVRIDRQVAPDQDRLTIPLRRGRNDIIFKVINTGGEAGFFFRGVSDENRLGHDLFAALVPDDARAEPLEARLVHAWRVEHSPLYRKVTQQLASLEAQLAKLRAEIPVTMVMSERPSVYAVLPYGLTVDIGPRKTFVLDRGLYDLPDKQRPVDRAVPAVLGSLPPDVPVNRLGLARWIVSRDNPLTARVTVNRLWEQFFGTGIVATGEDFGMQGEWPSHPELLDWLAVEFRESGWDLHAMIRLIVTSATYRQSSQVRQDVVAEDPENRLLAFYPRHRLAAEQLRDQALYVSGLLVEKLGGPPVNPYQPPGLWEEVSMLQSNTRTYVEGEGEDFWRRSLYTYWKRAVPPPSMLTFDAPTREFCVTRRLVTNTPLQALVLWNDPQFVEAARVLAARVISESPDDRTRLTNLVRRCTSREPLPEQLDTMADVLAEFRERYAASPEDAASLVKTGRAPVPEAISPAELAAWTMLANAVLSADAAISKN